ncbi:5'-3' exonuclease H3TH domain-containing protein [Romboutsia sedimentorum]|uniref:5'-3' exonuclease n=1 Tax=Romboutsia sedimentorum TaxID=1368474 RepID=A0ABT7EB30_9FIRM|nr:5'-3' exonuclease H3TH domain-containing protein [Romboutsia sedimentorum]MDK2564139.1 5'-3' exonuclease H3TH domain-containing protein [Romboutsia sedimentorum]
MENLFDFLEKKIKIENGTENEIQITEEVVETEVFNIEIAKKEIDEKHLKYLQELKDALVNEETVKSSGLEKRDYIRLNSYVGSRLDTDLRGKSSARKNIEAELESNKTQAFSIDQLEAVSIDEDIFGDKEDKFLIVDGSSLLSTSFYATARDLLFAKTDEQKEFAYTKLMMSPDGEYTNGIYMFFKTLLPLLKNQDITHLAVVMDRSRDTFRREIDSQYKANRSETPHPLKSQFKLLTELLQEINIPVFSHCNYEADDFAGSLVKKFEKDIPIFLHTKDEDYIQLVSQYTRLWMVTGKAEDMYSEIGIDRTNLNVPRGVFEYTPNYVKHFKGIEPIQIIDAKAIEGDKSDNIKGVKNVGPVSSRPLIAHYGSIEEIYNNIENLDSKSEKELLVFFKETLGIKRSPLKNLLLYKEDAFISKKLATIKTDIEEVQDLHLAKLALDINYNIMNKRFENLGMNSLIKK